MPAGRAKGRTTRSKSCGAPGRRRWNVNGYDARASSSYPRTGARGNSPKRPIQLNERPMRRCLSTARASRRSRISSAFERKAFIPPAGHAADHLLDRVSQRREADRGLVRAIAVRAGPVHDEQLALRELRHPLPGHGPMRNVDRAGHVRLGKGLSASDVNEDEVRISSLHAFAYVPAIGLESEP